MISVLMPVFDTARWLEDAVRSVLAQEGPSFELLACDDGSTDGSWDLLQRFAGDPRVRLFRHEARVGQGITRNRLAREARGRYLVPCDSDDLLLPGNLAEHRREMEAHPEWGAVYSGLLVMEFDGQGRLARAPEVSARDQADFWDLQQTVINHGGSMIRRDLFLEAGGYEEDLEVGEDRGLWLRLAEIAPVGFHRGFVGYVWRRHPDQVTRRRPGDPALLVARALRRRAGRGVRWG